ncbi:MAG: DUF3306 domain-containing protein [Wenzhouxiangella sp.]
MSEAEDARKRPDEDAGAGADDEGFLQRWSRRKHQARRVESEPAPAASEAEPDPAETDAEKPGPTEAATSETETAAPEPPGDEDMPPLESIDQGGGVGDFFSPKVSASLRKAALRRLFAQPEFSAPEVLEEYAKDYSKPALLGNVITADMRFRAEQARLFAERKLKAALDAETRSETKSETTPALAHGESAEPPAAAASEALDSEAAADDEAASTEERLAENARAADQPADEPHAENRPDSKRSTS